MMAFRVGAAAVAVATLLLLASPAQAHPGVCADPELQLLSLGYAGPYMVSVAVNPAYPTVGSAQLVVGVCDADTLTPVQGARVELTPVSPDGRAGAVIRAFPRTQYPEEYSADVRIKEPGAWRYRVAVDGPHGPAVTEAQLQVLPAPGYDGGSTLVFLIVNSALLAGAGYVVWQVRRARNGRAVGRGSPADAANTR